MPDYRRAYQPGGTYFFTVVTAGRAKILASPLSVTLLRESIAATRQRWPFEITALVVLPDHLHTIWTLPDNDTDFSTRWAFLKKTFTTRWLARGGEERPVSESKREDRRRGVWQRRFWEHLIRDEADLEQHCDYIHYNPVRHELVACPHSWPYSSFSRCVEQRLYEHDWLCACSGRTLAAPSFDDLSATAAE